MGVGGITITQLLITVVILVVMLFPWWKIYSKAGYSGWLALLMFVPLVNIGMLFFLALADWPALRGVSRE
jgi:uncharacterized membrane protein YhaH (DUF805 family)